MRRTKNPPAATHCPYDAPEKTNVLFAYIDYSIARLHLTELFFDIFRACPLARARYDSRVGEEGTGEGTGKGTEKEQERWGGEKRRH